MAVLSLCRDVKPSKPARASVGGGLKGNVKLPPAAGRCWGSDVRCKRDLGRGPGSQARFQPTITIMRARGETESKGARQLTLKPRLHRFDLLSTRLNNRYSLQLLSIGC